MPEELDKRVENDPEDSTYTSPPKSLAEMDFRILSKEFGVDKAIQILRYTHALNEEYRIRCIEENPRNLA
jgi:hypothetical protein